MEKILQALGLDPKASVDDALSAIKSLQDASKPRPTSAREKRIREKMNLGLPRDTAEEAVINQEKHDAKLAKKKADAEAKSKEEAAAKAKAK